jgi:hypothetical protein
LPVAVAVATAIAAPARRALPGGRIADRPSQRQALANAPFPTFFPPAIWHRPADGEEVHINQVGASITCVRRRYVPPGLTID